MQGKVVSRRQFHDRVVYPQVLLDAVGHAIQLLLRLLVGICVPPTPPHVGHPHPQQHPHTHTHTHSNTHTHTHPQGCVAMRGQEEGCGGRWALAGPVATRRAATRAGSLRRGRPGRGRRPPRVAPVPPPHPPTARRTGDGGAPPSRPMTGAWKGTDSDTDTHTFPLLWGVLVVLGGGGGGIGPFLLAFSCSPLPLCRCGGCGGWACATGQGKGDTPLPLPCTGGVF